MRNTSSSLNEHFKSVITSLATCWKLERQDGITLCFTDHIKPLVIDNLFYEAFSSFTPTNIEVSCNMAVDNLDITGQFKESGITEADLIAGKYDFAEVEIFSVNYENLTQGKLNLKRGILGEVTISKNMFCAEIRGLTQHLTQTMCEEYLPHCRAILGDKRCKFDLRQADFTVSSRVTEVIDNISFKASSLNQPRDWFTYGYLSWQSGKNERLKMEVREFASSIVTLALPMPFVIKEGDNFTIVAGCDKSSQTCIEKFNNIINFRGEPDLPGTDRMLATAGTTRR